MGLFRKGPVEYKRTCRKCGSVRYVPAELANMKAPSKLQLAGAKTTAAGSRASLVSLKGAAKEQHVTRLEAQRDRVLELAMCPSCGSVDFEQTPA